MSFLDGILLYNLTSKHATALTPTGPTDKLALNRDIKVFVPVRGVYDADEWFAAPE